MKLSISALIAGLIFGMGLIISEMVNPLRVRGFLDVSGLWDPTLMFVMIGALIISAIFFKLAVFRKAPLFSNTFSLPSLQKIDRPLILGAMMFGVGWGISGLCPGPAIVGLATANTDIIIFMLAMTCGMKLHKLMAK
jgi:uncharacterized membrane protein YedE/YeeE